MARGRGSDDTLAVRVRALRRRGGLSQAALAHAADLERTQIAAIEAGHAPSVHAALALARALGTTVEALVARDPQDARIVALGGPLADGETVVAARVGEALTVQAVSGAVLGDSFTPPAGRIVDGAIDRFAGAVLEAFAIAGCDPLLGVVASLLDAGPGRVVAFELSSAAARDALAAGHLHAALVHGPEGQLPRVPTGVHRHRVARWRVGVAGDRPVELDEVRSGTVGVVQRSHDAASQTAFDRVVAGTPGADRPPVRRARGHLDAARCAQLLGVPAVTYEPAARAFDLAFTPLEVHDVEIWIAADQLDHPGAAALMDLLSQRRFADRIDAVGGYELAA